ncbi:MAG: InlB B-repeat-containing protein [Bacilli bacterium]|jgi:uncharacterized repeat protein (TIGR02543 family)
MKIKTFLFILLASLFVFTGCKTKEIEEFTIKFINWDETVLSELILEKGATITAPADPTREGYEFVGWDKTFSTANSEVVITAQFNKLAYTVKFYDANGAVLKQEIVEYGDDATAPANPKKAGYDFVAWDKAFTNVKSNLDVNPVFEEGSYKLSFYDGATPLTLGVNSYKRTEELVLPTPTKEGYAFVGWFVSDISFYEITKLDASFKGDLKLYSRWVRTAQSNLTAPANVGEFTQIIKKPHSSGAGFVYQPEFPSGASTTSVTQYDWASSDATVATVSQWSSISTASIGYAIITATLKTDSNIVYWCVIKTTADGVVKASLEEANAPSFVTATFKLSETEEVEKIVQKGGFAIAPTPYEKEGYIFTGWKGEADETIYNITKDTTFIPTYEEGTNSYAGKTISLIGDSITTYNGYIPSGFAYFYPYATADLADVNQTWWMQFINYFGMKLLVNNAWSGSAVAGDAQSAAQKVSRTDYTFIGEVKPDVIVIMMGANDAGSSYINLSQFEAAYNVMLNNLKTSCPDSEIILCTLPSITLYSEEDQIAYNNVIKAYATNNDYKVIDFADAFTRDEVGTYLVDSAHPNKSGMDKMAETAIDDFKTAIK